MTNKEKLILLEGKIGKMCASQNPTIEKIGWELLEILNENEHEK